MARPLHGTQLTRGQLSGVATAKHYCHKNIELFTQVEGIDSLKHFRNSNYLTLFI